MKETVRGRLENFVLDAYKNDAQAILSYLPDCALDLSSIKAVMINEVVADAPENDFYSDAETPYYMQSTLPLFQKAGATVSTIQDILNLGVYITSAVKLPKEGSAVETETIKQFVPFLQKELALFPNVQVIMLMGDVAKKAFNMIAKSETKKNAIPAGSTYKLRHTEITYQGMRLLPAYIMTGQNLAIEKSKTEMSAEEIAKMLELINNTR